MELSNFDSKIPMTAALDRQTMRWSSSISVKDCLCYVGKMKSSSLKTSHSLLPKGWFIQEDPITRK